MSTPALQLTITIPEGVTGGSLLKIPVNGGKEKITTRVPEGMSAGDTLVLTKVEGSDEWVEDVGNVQPELKQAEEALLRESSGVELDTVRYDFSEQAQADVLLDETLRTPAPRKNPVAENMTQAPAQERVAYTVRLDTSVGIIDIIVRPDWAPHGARRFLDLAASGELDDLAFYRSVKGCLAQFGLPSRHVWPPLPDDPPVGVPFLLGAVCFAAVGENSRRSTLFICIGDMSHCFGQQPWETPIGAVAESSLGVLDRIETIYGDIAECNGAGPNTGRITSEGNSYLRSEFPLLTYIRSARPLDWKPPAQELEQVALAAQAVQAVQIAQSVHAAESATNAAHAFQAARAAKVAAAAELAKAHKTDTEEFLKKLEAQEKVHQAAMKEMEKKIAEAAESAQHARAEAVALGHSMERQANEQSFTNGRRLIEVPVETLPQGSLRGSPHVDPRLQIGRSSSRGHLISPRPTATRSLSRSPSSTSFADARHAPIVSHSVIYDNSAMGAPPVFRPPSREPYDPYARHAYSQSPRGFPPQHFPQSVTMPPRFPHPGLQPLGSQPLSPMRPSFSDNSGLFGHPPSRSSSPLPSPMSPPHPSQNIYSWHYGAQSPPMPPPVSMGAQYPVSHQGPLRWPMY